MPQRLSVFYLAFKNGVRTNEHVTVEGGKGTRLVSLFMGCYLLRGISIQDREENLLGDL